MITSSSWEDRAIPSANRLITLVTSLRLILLPVPKNLGGRGRKFLGGVVGSDQACLDRICARDQPDTADDDGLDLLSRMCRQIVVYETPSSAANSPTRKPRRRLTGQ